VRTVKEILEEIAAKQATVFAIFKEAKTEDGQYDFSKVTSVSGTPEAKLAEAQRLNEELNALGTELTEAKGLATAAVDTAKRQAWLSEPPGRPQQPGGEGKGEPSVAVKSLGQYVVDSEEFKATMGHSRKSLSIEHKDIQNPIAYLKTLFLTTDGFAPESTRTGRIVEAALLGPQVLDIIPSTPTAQAAVVYMEETVTTEAAAERAEGAAYAEADISYAEASSTVRSIGVSLPVTDEQLEDVPGIQGLLNGRLSFFLRRRLDGQVLVGNGTAPNLSGILDQSGLQTQAKGTDPVFDAIHKAITKVLVTGAADPSAIVLHPNDWEGIRLTRTTDGIYILGNPADAGPKRLWSLPVVTSNQITENTGLVGDFATHCELRPRRGIEVEVGFVADQFKEGEQTIRAGLRTAFVVYRAAAFCSVTGI